MKFSSKLNIILGSLLIVSLIIIFLLIFFQGKYKKKVTEKNDRILIEYKVKEKEYIKKLEDREKQIDELNKTGPKTEKEIIYKKIVEKDTELINECQKEKELLKDQLDKTNDVLKKQNSKKNEILGFGLIGLDKTLNIDTYVGLMYMRTLYSGKLIDIKFGGGGAIKLYENIGGAISLQLAISF